MLTLAGKTREELAALFDYSVVTGRVYRKVKRAQQPAGKRVGTVDGKGYLHVAMNGRFILLHRLAVFLLTGELPKQVDHANRDRRCNSWHNLRAADAQRNAGNSGLASHNTSGFKGVSYQTKSGKWHAQIKINGKQTYLGRRDTPEEAAVLYEAAARKHFGEFAHVVVN
jgi:hypothetical protein